MKDTRPATWANILRRARRDAARLRGLGMTVIEPENFHLHPDFRPKAT